VNLGYGRLERVTSLIHAEGLAALKAFKGAEIIGIGNDQSCS
jgi:hypothetical protein